MKAQKLSSLFLVSLFMLFSACSSSNTSESSYSHFNSSVAVCQHEHQATIVDKQATCTEKGAQSTLCEDCQAVLKTEELPLKDHNYQSISSETINATCTTDGKTVKECLDCGNKVENVIIAEGHSFSSENTSSPYFVFSNATQAIYYKSCACGEKSDQTFTLTLDSTFYQATSPTLTLYDTENLSYGITWNYEAKPYTPVVAVRMTEETDWNYYDASAQQYSTKTQTETTANFYVCKAVFPLLPNTNYEYKIIELASNSESETYTFTSANPQKESFSFVSFSDTQNNDALDGNWSNVLKYSTSADFYLHSGDICEDSAHEYYWTNMLDYNKNYLAKKPLMVAAGNHDTIYKSGSNELFKHFNNRIPTQANTKQGYYYSFTYGNTKFIIINTNDLSSDRLPTEQYSWLVDELKNNDARWTIVTMHCPMYSIGTYGTTKGEISRSLRSQLNDIFVEYGVDLVIQGHDHTLSKTFPIGKNSEVVKAETQKINGINYSIDPQGPIYIMNGATGSDKGRSPSDEYETEFYEYAESGPSNAWAQYTITDQSIVVRVKYLSSNVSTIKTWGIMKN